MSILSAVIVSGAIFIGLQFVLKPLIMAYFVTFLMAPLMDMFEKRPYDALGDKGTCCKKNFASDQFWQYVPQTNDYYEKLLTDINMETGKFMVPTDEQVTLRNRLTQDEWNIAKDHAALHESGAAIAVVKDLLVVGKLPHMLACTLTMVLSVAIVFGSFSLIMSNFTDFMESEKLKPEEEQIIVKMVQMANGFVDDIETNIKIYRPLVCPPRSLDNITLTAIKKVSGYEAGKAGYAEFTFKHIGELKTKWENKTDHCYRQKIFGSSDGTTWEEFVGYVGIVIDLLNDTVLILLLAVYILLERPEGQTIGGDHPAAMQIEAMVKNYISLKFALSFLTGVLVGICLVICNVQMGIIFGFLSFLLNFIPNVGSMIAIVLPIPIIIMDENLYNDDGSPGWQIYVSIGIPCMIQGYVGNGLEPVLFGKSLNLTAISVLLSLVVFAYLWGLIGAVLSVPLLGGAKIVLYNTDHPIAQSMLSLVREDESLP